MPKYKHKHFCLGMHLGLCWHEDVSVQALIYLIAVWLQGKDMHVGCMNVRSDIKCLQFTHLNLLSSLLLVAELA